MSSPTSTRVVESPDDSALQDSREGSEGMRSNVALTAGQADLDQDADL
jgi:hypothetical protein